MLFFHDLSQAIKKFATQIIVWFKNKFMNLSQILVLLIKKQPVLPFQINPE